MSRAELMLAQGPSDHLGKVGAGAAVRDFPVKGRG